MDVFGFEFPLGAPIYRICLGLRMAPRGIGKHTSPKDFRLLPEISIDEHRDQYKHYLFSLDLKKSHTATLGQKHLHLMIVDLFPEDHRRPDPQVQRTRRKACTVCCIPTQFSRN